MPPETAASLRACSSRDRGPGISVTRRRSWGRDGPPRGTSLMPLRGVTGRGDHHGSDERFPRLVRAASVDGMTRAFPLLIGGKHVEGPETLEINSPYDGRAIGTTTWASKEQVEDAVAAAASVAEEAANLPLQV